MPCPSRQPGCLTSRPGRPGLTNTGGGHCTDTGTAGGEQVKEGDVLISKRRGRVAPGTDIWAGPEAYLIASSPYFVLRIRKDTAAGNS